MSRVVADASNNLRHRVLHIRSQPRSSPGVDRSTIDELLASSPLETELCGDVYRGLARILSPSSDPPRAVIVCLDGLMAPELEFFSILSRMRPDLSVYVYGGGRSDAGTAKAIELGATAPLTREVLVELAGPPPVSPTAPAPPPVREGSSDTPLSPVNQPAPPAPARGDPDDPRRAARVPWLRYGDRPARVAPGRREPTTPEALPASRPSSRSTSFEPLLTEEELRALMTDDIAAIAPDEPEAPWPDGDESPRGAP